MHAFRLFRNFSRKQYRCDMIVPKQNQIMSTRKLKPVIPEKKRVMLVKPGYRRISPRRKSSVAEETTNSATKSLHSSVLNNAVEDHESELESLFKLNLDAASGELPRPETSAKKRTDSSNNISSNMSVSEPKKESASLNSNVKSRVIKRQKRLPENSGADMLSEHGFVPFTDDQDGVPFASGKLRVRSRNTEHNREAISALVSSFQSFVESDNFSTDTPFPLALPVPRAEVAETSALREFQLQMVERHRSCEVPTPTDSEFARFLIELPDGEGIHIQLPSLSFPNLRDDNISDAHFAQVGSIDIDSDVSLNSIRHNGKFNFKLTRQNVPSNISEILVFHNVNAESGTVSVSPGSFTASLSATVNVQGSCSNGPEILLKRDRLVSRIRSETDLKASDRSPQKRMFTDDRCRTDVTQSISSPLPTNHAKRARTKAGNVS